MAEINSGSDVQTTETQSEKQPELDLIELTKFLESLDKIALKTLVLDLCKKSASTKAEVAQHVSFVRYKNRFVSDLVHFRFRCKFQRGCLCSY
jgi:hypothetical protein